VGDRRELLQVDPKKMDDHTLSLAAFELFGEIWAQ
jgi:hypothetical protein